MPAVRLEKKDWLNAKRHYIYTDATMKETAERYGISRQALSTGFRRNFPGTDFQSRKQEESEKRAIREADKIEEKRQVAKVRLEDKLDIIDEDHLELIKLLLEGALNEARSGQLKAKSIKDIVSLIDMDRTIRDKHRSTDKVVVIRAEKPEMPKVAEILDGECEVLE